MRVKQAFVKMPVEVTMQLGMNIFNRAAEKRQVLDSWCREERDRKALAEITECSFKPDISLTRKRDNSYSSQRRQ